MTIFERLPQSTLLTPLSMTRLTRSSRLRTSAREAKALLNLVNILVYYVTPNPDGGGRREHRRNREQAERGKGRLRWTSPRREPAQARWRRLLRTTFPMP